MSLAYPVEFEPDGDLVVASVPDLAGCHTQGISEEDALNHCLNAIEEMLASLIEDRESIPLPSAPDGRPVVTPTPLTSLKVALYMVMREQKVRKADLARMMNVNQKQIDRLLDLNHHSRLDQFEAAFKALGQRMAISITPAERAA